MQLKKNLGKKIQTLRKAKKITQDQLALSVGIDPKNISRIENGMNYPSAETITSIAHALEVDIYELFVFNDIPYEQMREEIQFALSDNQKTLFLYKCLKNSA